MTPKPFAEALDEAARKIKDAYFNGELFGESTPDALFLKGAHFARQFTLDEVKGLAQALENLLRTVSLDWYVSLFAKPEVPSQFGSSVPAMIHNQELAQRATIAFTEARETLTAYQKAQGKTK